MGMGWHAMEIKGGEHNAFHLGTDWGASSWFRHNTHVEMPCRWLEVEVCGSGFHESSSSFSS